MDKSNHLLETKNEDRFTSKPIFLLGSIVLIAFIMRMLSYSSVTASGGITLLGYDTFYHMRRILYSVSNFPGYLQFDSYLNYPFGFEIGWPPLFDLLGALLALILGSGKPDIQTAEFAASLLPVLLGVLTIIPVYAVASTLFDSKTGISSALIFAFMPVHIYISQFGMVDHHVVEVLLSTASYASFIFAIQAGKNAGLSFAALKDKPSDKNLLKPLIFAAGTGIGFALSLYTWLGSPLFIGFLALYFLLQATLNLKTHESSAYLFICCAVSYLTALVLISPACLGSGMELSAMHLSGFHIFFLLAMLAAVLVLYGLSLYMGSRNLDWKYYPCIVLILFALGMLLLRAASAEAYSYIVAGFEYALGIGEYLEKISEALPLFFTSEGTLTLSKVMGNFGLCFPLALLTFGWLTLKEIEEKTTPEKVFFLLWTLFTSSLAFFQVRYSYLFSVNVAILTGVLVLKVLLALKPIEESKKLIYSKEKLLKNSETATKERKSLKARRTSKNFSSLGRSSQKADLSKIIGAMVFLGLVLGPCAGIAAGIAKESVAIDGDWTEALNWMASNTPKTSYFDMPSEKPEYGVMSWWDYGNWILYIAKRPPVSNNFQTGVEDSAHFFLSPEENQANEILKARNAKYVITDTKMVEGKFTFIAGLGGKNSSYYTTIKSINTNLGIQNKAYANENYWKTELVKLHLLDASTLGHMRLIHEAGNVVGNNNSRNGNIKIFEYVPGAKITGTATPNQQVRAQLKLKTNTGREFTYYNTALADQEGHFEITVPYSTEGSKYGVVADGTYSLKCGEDPGKTGTRVKESDVLDGARIDAGSL